MAVGKGSVARAAKAQNAKTVTATKKVAAATKVVDTGTVAAPDEAVLQQIVYQSSSGMLERDAKPNERFGLGDAMPVYYF